MVLGKLRAILRHKRYELYTRPYELNIVGLRGNSTEPNKFDDEIHVFYKISPIKWNYHVFKATTDPGTFWLKNPLQKQGTAILSEGQYLDTYQLGMHQGKYKALVQRKPVTVIRDYDRNAKLDFLNGTKTTGLYGINIHRANKTGTTRTVDKYSAGCQVFEKCRCLSGVFKTMRTPQPIICNKFTYTLIDFRSVKRENIRRIAYGIGTLGLIAVGYFSFKSRNKIAQLFKRKEKTDNEN
ncbi:MAG: hypothetical protein IPJ32_00045 [Sphingobacteriaceae bacterium]|nr:hypothetical protein [Sphingobacteriaceae bacterium]